MEEVDVQSTLQWQEKLPPKILNGWIYWTVWKAIHLTHASFTQTNRNLPRSLTSLEVFSVFWITLKYWYILCATLNYTRGIREIHNFLSAFRKCVEFNEAWGIEIIYISAVFRCWNFMNSPLSPFLKHIKAYRWENFTCPKIISESKVRCAPLVEN